MAFDQKSRQAGRLLFVLDILLTAFVFVFAYDLRDWLVGRPVDFWRHIALLPLVLGLMAPLMWLSGAYERMRVRSLFTYGWIVARSAAIMLVLLSTVLFLLKAGSISRVFLLIFCVLLLIVLVGMRATLVWWYFRRAVERRENYLKVVIIGTGDRARRLADKLRQHSEWGVEILGYLDPEERQLAPAVSGAPVLGRVGDIAQVLQSRVVDEVIVAVPRSLLGDAQVIADVCAQEGVLLRFMADVFDLQVSRMSLVRLDEIPLLTFEPVAQDERKLIVKRIFDLAVTLAAMPVLLPILLVVAVAVKLDSPGPVLFRQPRVGLRKRPFPMYKFRSMYRDAEQRLKEIEHLNEAQGPIFKIANDPRVTRVGRFIRRTSLDELPQLFNVIRGHMSLVGPRPMSLRDVGLFDQSIQRRRFSVRPGLTCLWQISGRSNLPFEKWLALDLAYIDNWSLGLDLKILLKTVPIILRGTGAV
ncbi:MAG: sugar transferase [Gammaproteobacteria bacterium]|nr:sugar transferase [Gammaproteobacteria bacterium]